LGLSGYKGLKADLSFDMCKVKKKLKVTKNVKKIWGKTVVEQTINYKQK
jgi:hypothetical protein